MSRSVRSFSAAILTFSLMLGLACPLPAYANWRGGGWHGGGWGWRGGGWGWGWGGWGWPGWGWGGWGWPGWGWGGVVIPPPVVYAPPPVVYAPPSASGPTLGFAQACHAGPYRCPLRAPTTPGAHCSCPADPRGRAAGFAG
jgi:hypothetical protein